MILGVIYLDVVVSSHELVGQKALLVYEYIQGNLIMETVVTDADK